MTEPKRPAGAVNNHKKSRGEPYDVVRQLEAALCEYTGARFAVTVSSCTAALMLAVRWWMSAAPPSNDNYHKWGARYDREVSIPRRTYLSVPMSIIHAAGRPTFRDEDWRGAYQLKPLPVWDSARRFTSGMYSAPAVCDSIKQQSGESATCCRCGATALPGTKFVCKAPPASMAGQFLCVSFHAAKILGDTQGGAILHDDPVADAWLRRARFDGRLEGVAPKDDTGIILGHHCYMSNDVAARLLHKLTVLPERNEDLPNDDFPDLSTMEIFK